MRRKLAAAFLAAGLFAAAGCGGDGGGGGASTEDICDDINETVDPLETELTSALQQAGMAAAQEDEAALESAVVELNRVVSEVTGAVRDGADDSDDEEFSQALRDFANELEGLIGSVSSGETSPDMSGLDAASDRLEGYCGE